MAYNRRYHRALNPIMSCFIMLTFLIFWPMLSTSHAEVTMDGSLGPSGAVGSGTLPDGTFTDYLITHDLGSHAGNNLFHSFGMFNVDINKSATFTGPNSIDNIIGRVTGGTQSWIDGLLRSTIDGANLFLLNPAGVLFGPNASLDVKGSFHVSTADYLRFEDGERFYVNLAENSVLSVASPVAFGFLSQNPAGISIQESVLQVPEGETLSVVGGDIEIVGGEFGFLSAPGGRINVASVASPGEVIPNSPGETTDLRVDSFESLGTINLTQGAALDVSGDSGGTVVIRGGHFMFETSSISSNTLGNVDGASIGIDIDIRGDFSTNGSVLRTAAAGEGRSGDILIASNSMAVENNSTIEAYTYVCPGNSGDIEITSGSLAVNNSQIRAFSYYGPGDSGNIKILSDTLEMNNSLIRAYTYRSSGGSGDIDITTDNLSMDNSRIGAYTYGGAGGGGDIRIMAESVILGNGSKIDAYTNWTGVSGNIEIKSHDLVVENDSTILVYTSGLRDSGNIEIMSDTLSVNDSIIEAFSYYSPGAGGDITITSKNFTVENYSGIGVYTEGAHPELGAGDGGDLRIKSDTLTVNDSGICAYTYGPGDGGNLEVSTGSLDMINGGQIWVDTFLSGDSGDLEVTADTVYMNSANSTYPVTIAAWAGGGSTGHGGDLRLTTGTLELWNGALLDTTTYGAGDAGILELNADSVLLSGRNEYNAPAGIFGRAIGSGGGNAGGVHITTDSLEVRDGAQISTSSFGIGAGGDLEVTADHVLLTPVNMSGVNSGLTTGFFARGYIGDGGSIQITAGSLEVMGGAAISASSKRSGAGGDIDVIANSIFLSGFNQYGNRSGIYSQSDNTLATGAAGDIRITTESLDVKDGAQITVAALGPGDSGNLEINAGSILLSGRSSDFSSRLNASTQTDAQGGSISITSDLLEVKDGAKIQAMTFGSGNAGAIDIDAERVLVSGVESGKAARIIAQADYGSSGKGGDVQIRAGSLEVKDGAEISVGTFGSGDGGTIEVTAESVVLDGGSNPELSVGLYSGCYSSGDAGDVRIKTGSLEVVGGAQISSSTRGSGDGGSIDVNAERIYLSGANNTQVVTGLFAVTGGSGHGGGIFVTTENLQVMDGAAIDSSAFSSGDGGKIEVSAKSIVIGGVNSGEVRAGILASTTGTATGSGDAGIVCVQAENLQLQDRGLITTQTLGPGAGGEIELEVTKLKLASGGEISSSSQGSGQAGAVTVVATESVSISGLGHEKSSGLFSTASDAGNAGCLVVTAPSLIVTDGGEINTSSSGAGAGGDIQVQVDKLNLSSGSLISSSSVGLGDGGSITIMATDTFYSDNSSVSTAAEQAKGGDIAIGSREIELVNGTLVSAESSGAGNAGNIHITATDTFLMRDSAVTTGAKQADGGNIKVSAEYMVYLINSEITSSVGGGPETVGGNISIDPQYVILKNSKIIANAYEGMGGNIDIIADVFLADPDSIVDASSALGIDGLVNIRAPVKEITGILTPLPKDFRSALALLREPCMARIQGGKYSSFVVGGRDGLPLEPGGLLPSPIF